ncbi:hypothetical protein ACEPAI_4851 [Sanghuangporus weigelae]
MTEDSGPFNFSWTFGTPVEASCTVPSDPGDAVPDYPTHPGSRTPSCRTSSSPSTESFEFAKPETEPGIPTEINNLNKASSTELILTDNDSSPTNSGKKRDEQFYYTLTTFEVENVLFRVPRRSFEMESSVFKEMFELPSDGSSDGITDEKPLTLSGITVENFRAFLRVLFDPAHGSLSELKQDEWISVLQVSHMWSCDRLFALAISKLSVLEVDPFLKITLAKAYNIKDWWLPAYFSIVTRADPLTLQEAEKLGMETTMKLTEVRESRYRWIVDDLEEPRPQSIGYSPYPYGKKGKKSARDRSPVNLRSVKKDLTLLDGDVRNSIKQLFGL